MCCVLYDVCRMRFGVACGACCVKFGLVCCLLLLVVGIVFDCCVFFVERCPPFLDWRVLCVV